MVKHIFTYSFLTLIALVGFFGNIDIEFNNSGPQFFDIRISSVNTGNAADVTTSEADFNAADAAQLKAQGMSNGQVSQIQNGEIKTIVSEKVPGATCTCYNGADCTKVETRKYICTTGKGLVGFQLVFAKLIRFVVNMVLLLGVLAVVGLGIAWSFAGGEDVKAKSTLKTWAINIIIGLAILFLFREILVFLAPWVYK